MTNVPTIFDQISAQDRDTFLSVLKQITQRSKNEMLVIPLTNEATENVVLIPYQHTSPTLKLDDTTPFVRSLKQQLDADENFIDLT